ncbi:S4 domain-containing protein YaaA [Halobacillus litoralis]|uniref:S4 domain-containing protein YaaA n=1 Tax=Halobacillus litoralis TaxID=45668 RepID=A0A845DV77_9BACI|nr:MULTISPECIES: S4 domain-containing protein YaaA [Halobacillus]MCA1020476.1 S4 domain-containing protein YaaA [Halobacillus litoralis]MYL20709.1 S4 domain-containing protein YaaA [Halobacillus litoralis]MYL29799.1 S4 domain-containing protein YaaA [Halobacillus halophilus]MYL39299.1 S4 domain-containing protein YaaA [Halobacillus litoralis]
MSEEIGISTEYIPLGQFLKLANVVESGGMVKIFLAEFEVNVNGEPENRRGRKLYVGDTVEIEEFGSYKVVSEG